MPELVKISDALQRATASVRRLKEGSARRPVNTVVEVYRGGEPAALFGLRPDRDAMLAVARAAATGLGADVLVVALESWHSTLLKSPVTGKPWAPDEMEELARNHHGRERGWVSDAIVLHVANRAGDFAGAILPYTVDRGVCGGASRGTPPPTPASG
jgi:hypothetical protein